MFWSAVKILSCFGTCHNVNYMYFFHLCFRTQWHQRCSIVTWRRHTSQWRLRLSTAWSRSQVEYWWTRKMQRSPTEITRWGERWTDAQKQCKTRDMQKDEQRNKDATSNSNLLSSAIIIFIFQYLLICISGGWEVFTLAEGARILKKILKSQDVMSIKFKYKWKWHLKPSKIRCQIHITLSYMSYVSCFFVCFFLICMKLSFVS